MLQCPPIPRILTAECEPPARDLATNGDVARALLDARECLAISAIRLQAIRELADCRTTDEGRKSALSLSKTP